MIRKITIVDQIAAMNEEAITLDGLDAAIVGITTAGSVAYSVSRILKILMDRDGMDAEEADEFFGFNIECLGLGEFTPIFIHEKNEIV
jgi:hypothetical protein